MNFRTHARQALLVLTLLVTTSGAMANDTAWLLNQLRNPNDAHIGGSKAYSLMLGITNGLTIYDDNVAATSKPFCLPEGFHVESLISAVQVYVTKHPGAQRWVFTKTIGAVLVETYPCKK